MGRIGEKKKLLGTVDLSSKVFLGSGANSRCSCSVPFLFFNVMLYEFFECSICKGYTDLHKVMQVLVSCFLINKVEFILGLFKHNILLFLQQDYKKVSGETLDIALKIQTKVLAGSWQEITFY